MQTLTIFFAFICILQVIFANPINETNNVQSPEKDMMETAANNVVFRPLFVYRHQQEARRRAREHRQRCRRHANTVNENGTNNDKKPVTEMMETAANNVVFRPLFVYRQQQEARRRARQHHQRCRRHATQTTDVIGDDEPLPVLPLSTKTSKTVISTEKAIPTTVKPETTTPNIERKSKNAHHHDGSDLDHHESGLVFRPLFVYRQQQAARRRISAERRNQADRRYYESVPTYNYYPTYSKPYKPAYKPPKKDCHDPNKELYI